MQISCLKAYPRSPSRREGNNPQEGFFVIILFLMQISCLKAYPRSPSRREGSNPQEGFLLFLICFDN